MFRIKTIAAGGLVVVALAALGASAPVASAKGPCKSTDECFGVLREGVKLPVKENDPIDIVSEGVVTFTGKNLVVNCPQGELNGSIIIVKGNLEASITGATFGGSGGTPCNSSMGPAVVSAPGSPVPWLLKTNGKSFSGPLSLQLGVDASGLSCHYAAKSVKGSYNTDEEPIVIGSKPPKFNLQEGSSPGCPRKLTGSANAWDVNVGSPAGGEGSLVFVG
jgi:hypothetical protein